MKRIVSLLVSAVMLFAMTATAFAGPQMDSTMPDGAYLQYDEGWNKVYRHSDSSIAEDAAQWAEDTYKDSDAEYVITMDLESTDETYCSKLVWQAYYYGHTPSAANGPTWGVRLPYSLPDSIHNLDLGQEWL